MPLLLMESSGAPSSIPVSIYFTQSDFCSVMFIGIREGETSLLHMLLIPRGSRVISTHHCRVSALSRPQDSFIGAGDSLMSLMKASTREERSES